MRTTLIPFKGTGLPTPFPTDWNKLVSYCNSIDSKMRDDAKYTIPHSDYKKLLGHIKKHLPIKITLENGFDELQKCKTQNTSLAIREVIIENLYLLILEKARIEIHAQLNLLKEKKAGENFDGAEINLKAKKAPDTAAKVLWNLLNQIETIRNDTYKVLPDIISAAINGESIPLFENFQYVILNAESINDLNFVKSFMLILKLTAAFPSELISHVFTLNPLASSFAEPELKKLKEQGNIPSENPADLAKMSLAESLFAHYQIKNAYDGDSSVKVAISHQMDFFKSISKEIKSSSDLQSLKEQTVRQLEQRVTTFNSIVEEFTSGIPLLGDLPIELRYWEEVDREDEKTNQPIKVWEETTVSTTVNNLKDEVKRLHEESLKNIDDMVREYEEKYKLDKEAAEAAQLTAEIETARLKEQAAHESEAAELAAQAAAEATRVTAEAEQLALTLEIQNPNDGAAELVDPVIPTDRDIEPKAQILAGTNEDPVASSLDKLSIAIADMEASTQIPANLIKPTAENEKLEATKRQLDELETRLNAAPISTFAVRDLTVEIQAQAKRDAEEKKKAEKIAAEQALRDAESKALLEETKAVLKQQKTDFHVVENPAPQPEPTIWQRHGRKIAAAITFGLIVVGLAIAAPFVWPILTGLAAVALIKLAITAVVATVAATGTSAIVAGKIITPPVEQIEDSPRNSSSSTLLVGKKTKAVHFASPIATVFNEPSVSKKQVQVGSQVPSAPTPGLIEV